MNPCGMILKVSYVPTLDNALLWPNIFKAFTFLPVLQRKGHQVNVGLFLRKLVVLTIQAMRWEH